MNTKMSNYVTPDGTPIPDLDTSVEGYMKIAEAIGYDKAMFRMLDFEYKNFGEFHMISPFEVWQLSVFSPLKEILKSYATQVINMVKDGRWTEEYMIFLMELLEKFKQDPKNFVKS